MNTTAINVPPTRVLPNPYQTRSVVWNEGIKELADNIRQHGLLQPPRGRLVDSNNTPLPPDQVAHFLNLPSVVAEAAMTRYDWYVQLAFGHRRHAACAYLSQTDTGWQTMPILVEVIPDERMELGAWIENEDRQDLGPIQKARALQAMLTQHPDWTQDTLATRIGKSRPWVSNMLGLLDLPPEVQTRTDKGELSTRQAQALVPLARLPEVTRQRAEDARWGVGRWDRPSEIIQRAPNQSSDQLRRDVEQAIQMATKPLDKIPWPNHDFGQTDDLQAPRCTACPVVVQTKDGPRCGDGNCWNRKEHLHTGALLTDAAKATGIPAVENPLAWQPYESFWESDREHARQIMADGCPKGNLRLAYTHDGSVNVEGFPDVSVVCSHGKGARCTCLAQLKTAAAKNDPAKVAKAGQEKQITEQIVQPATMAVARAIRNWDARVWSSLAHKVSPDVNPRPEWSIERIIDAIAYTMVQARVPWITHDDTNLVRAQAGVGEYLTQIGIPVPWGPDTQIRELQTKLDRVLNWVAELPHHLPTNGEIWTNIMALDRLRQACDKTITSLPSGEPPEWTATEYQDKVVDAANRLHKIAHILKEWNLEDYVDTLVEFSPVSHLVEAPVDSSHFQQALAEASLNALRYALILVEGKDDYRAGTIRSQIEHYSEKEKPL